MAKRFFYILGSVLFLAHFTHCAKRGMPTGGPEDTIPPTVVRTFPENYSTNFDKDEITIAFNEYIKLQSPQQQIIFSPPMSPKPSIRPLGGASKSLEIIILDTLAKNTTYSINFGKSIADNNEENPFPFYKYVFSTGNYIDSLQVTGKVSNVLKKQTDAFISVMLYKADSTYTDSVIYEKAPTYIAYTKDSTNTFSLENLKEGKYKMLAVADKNENYKFDPKTEKIGFVEGFINLPTDSTYSISVFEENLDLKLIRPKQVSKNHLIFGYEGLADSVKINLLNANVDNYNYQIIKDSKTDTLHYWFKPFFETDSLVFEVSGKNYKDTLVTRIKDMLPDSLNIKASHRGSINIDEDFGLHANIPLRKIDTSKIKLFDKDSVLVDFKTRYEALYNNYFIDFEKEPEQKYRLNLLPGALTDFFENQNDSLKYRLQTPNLSDLGILTFSVSNLDDYPVLLQLTNENDEVVKEKYHTQEDGNSFELSYLKPGTYYVRLIFDKNSNKKWDPGNFLKNKQPEKVIHYPKALEIRPNWDVVETFILN